jgi:hypothetical protein
MSGVLEQAVVQRSGSDEDDDEDALDAMVAKSTVKVTRCVSCLDRQVGKRIVPIKEGLEPRSNKGIEKMVQMPAEEGPPAYLCCPITGKLLVRDLSLGPGAYSIEPSDICAAGGPGGASLLRPHVFAPERG